MNRGSTVVIGVPLNPARENPSNNITATCGRRLEMTPITPSTPTNSKRDRAVTIGELQGKAINLGRARHRVGSCPIRG
jgi:hypothetical protein